MEVQRPEDSSPLKRGKQLATSTRPSRDTEAGLGLTVLRNPTEGARLRAAYSHCPEDSRVHDPLALHSPVGGGRGKAGGIMSGMPQLPHLSPGPNQLQSLLSSPLQPAPPTQQMTPTLLESRSHAHSSSSLAMTF